MASPFVLSSTPSSPVEEDVENVVAGSALRVLKWTSGSFCPLMLNIRIPDEYEAR
ncbi:hypothetical protein Hanom_Chr09g00812021 [Helianthus anomalus]